MLGLTLGPQFKRTRLGLGVFHRPSYAEATLASATVLNDYSTQTFTRASTAYDPYNRVTAISGARRRRPLALSPTLTVYADLIEGARTNLLLRSQDFNNASWSKTDTTVTSLATVAPDGTTTADLFTEGSAGTAATQQSVTITAASVFAYSRYVKVGAGNTWVMMRGTSDSGVNGFRAWFNLVTGVVGSIAAIGTGTATLLGIENAGNGWYRIWAVGKVDAAATALTLGLTSATADAAITRVSGCTFYSWGAQCEQMAASSTTGFPSSYIATTSATVTRAADALSVPYVLGQTGTVLALMIPYGWSGDQDGATTYTVWRGDDTNNSRVDRNNATSVKVRRPDAGGVQGNANTIAFVGGSLIHHGSTWDASAVTGYVNGANPTSDATLTPPYNTNTVITIGGSGAGAAAFFGHVALLAYPRVLSASELLAIYSAFPTA